MNSTQTWEERISAVAKVLNLTPDTVTLQLSEWGIEKEPMGLEMLDDDDVCKFGDFQQRFGTKDGVAIKMAPLRLAFKFLKGNTRASDRPSIDPRTLELRQRFGLKPSLETAEVAELLSVYNPTKPSDPVTCELVRRYGTDPAVAFKPDTEEVDVVATVAYLSDLAASIVTKQTTTVSEGRLVPLVPFGQRPMVLLDEDPMWVGVPLNRGVSTKNYRNWNGIDLETRQLCRLIMQAGHVDPGDRAAVEGLITTAATKPHQLTDLYPEVELDFRTRRNLGTLPTLKLTVDQVDSKPKRPNHPFGTNTRY